MAHQRVHHLALHHVEPHFNFVFSGDWFDKRHIFPFSTDHAFHHNGPRVRTEVQPTDIVETLFYVFIDCLKIVSLSQNFQQLIIRQEVETRESETFFLQIVV